MNFKVFKSTPQCAKVITHNAGLFPVCNGDWLVYRNGPHLSLYSSLIVCYKGKVVNEIKLEGRDCRNPAVAPDGTVFFVDFTGHYIDGFFTKHQHGECRLMSWKAGKKKVIHKSKDSYYSPYGKAYIEGDKYVVSVYSAKKNFILFIENGKIVKKLFGDYGYNETAIYKHRGLWYGLARKGDWGVHILGFLEKSSQACLLKEVTDLDHPADICKVGSYFISAIGGRSSLHGNIRIFKGKDPLYMWDKETDYYIGEFDDFGYPTIQGKTVYFYGRHSRFGYLLFSFRID